MKNRALSGLYGITDARLLTNTDTLLSAVESALKGGMRLLQYRDKTSALETRLENAQALKVLCQKHNALLIINDDVELAHQVGADGVHVGQHDQSLQQARAVLGADAMIGCSCYNRIELAVEAEQKGADYVAFGRFFASITKPQTVQAELELIPQAKAALAIPVCAIGGITPTNAQPLIDLGADMIAVIHGLFGADDIEQQAQGFSRLF